MACDELIRLVSDELQQGLAIANIGPAELQGWLAVARGALVEEANRRECKLRELACTVMLAVVGEARAAFAQLGDGAIILSDGDSFRPVFWPQTGEYANSTFFLSDEDFVDATETSIHADRIDELAVLTDGLQRLALDYSCRVGHPGFFAPLFGRLRAADDPAELREPLRTLLDSPRINERTDDDKTLILATRVPPSVPNPDEPR
jgi:hypothetical protein